MGEVGVAIFLSGRVDIGAKKKMKGFKRNFVILFVLRR